MDTTDSVVIVGAGPSGLATAAELTARGVPAVVLERGPQIGAAWAGRYDGLRFNTSRRSSALPGAPFPREFGQFPTRDQYVSYLRRYAAERGVTVETGVEATRIRPAVNGDWTISTVAQGDRAADGERRARHVVTATGAFARPRLPAWADERSFTGAILHSSRYRGPAPFESKTVVVVGAGSSGMEIAYQLASGGAGRVLLSVRTPPNILFREINGVPGDLPVPLFLRLPPGFVDRLMFAMQRRVVGDLSAYGLPAPTTGAMTNLKVDGPGPAVVDPVVIDAIRSGAIECVPAVVGLDGDSVIVADGRRIRADVVVLATGYTTGLEDLVGGLGVLTERGMPLERTGAEVLPGLRFVGYVARPGITGYVGKIAKRVAREIAGQRAREAIGAIA
ncbi:NAD(P)/FAD-dependent oxidoreductase [Brevibacterium daeguense]|uniref:NAD(P)/FAD-dependent oxidoreductase n=1 Tax=Brevibacterium daeguense TaxID=909936 RepID=A0ABP8EIC6_9MICO|nr:NAD(P)/FAD-dependent oxidoreductase [Brevibacterium daeguense]